MNKTYLKLFYELKKYSGEVIIVMIAIAAISGSMLSLGYILRSLIDQGIAATNIQALNHSIMYMIFAVLALGTGSFLRAFYINSISNKVVSGIRIKTYKALLEQHPSYFDKIKISDISSRFSHDLSLIGDIITNLLSFSIRNSFTFIGGITMMFMQNIKLSSIVMISLPVSVILIKIIGKKVRNLAKQLHEQKSSLEGLIGETISNIRIVHTFNIKDYSIEKLTSEAKKSDNLTHYYLKIRASFFAISIFIITSLLIMVLWIGGVDVLNGNISSGNMVSFIFYAVITAFSIGGLAEVFGDLQKSVAGAERVFELGENKECIIARSVSDEAIHFQDTIDCRVMLPTPPNDGIKIHIKNFAYEARRDITIIKDISLEAKPGEFIGIAGPSGSGKSTIMHLITGTYQSPDCEVVVSNNANIAYTPQDPFLFSTSIKENITLGRDHGKLDETIKITGLDEVIKELPDGINTYVGEKGMQLSGGQKQRIALARSIYGKPEILLLDEATSALDVKSEHMILQNVKKLMKDKIIISVAHRLSSIKDANKIFLIDDGRIIAEGSHDDLLKKSPLYKHLVLVSKT